MFQYIASSWVSPEVYYTVPIVGKPTRGDLGAMVKEQIGYYWENKEENRMKIKNILFHQKHLNTIKKKRNIIIPLRPNLINMVTKLQCLKLSNQLMRKQI